MRASPLTALLAAAALAGCVAPGGGEVVSVPLGVPPAAQLVPGPADVPGFSLGHAQPLEGDMGALDGHSAVFDGNANGSGARLGVSVLRFASIEDAEASYARIAREMTENVTHPRLGDAALHSDERRAEAGMKLLLVRAGVVLWLINHFSPGQGAPDADLVAVAAPLVARVSS